MDTPSRRTVLGMVGASVGTVGAGCLASDRSDSSPSETGSVVRSTPSDADSTAQGRVDDLFVRNETETDQMLDLRIARSEDADGALLLSNRYEIPPDTVFEIADVGAVGERYTVEARLDGHEWQTFDWRILGCERHHTPSDDETPGNDPTLNTDALIEISDDGLRFARNECDALAFEVLNDAAAADEYAVESGTPETYPSTEPSQETSTYTSSWRLTITDEYPNPYDVTVENASSGEPIAHRRFGSTDHGTTDLSSMVPSDRVVVVTVASNDTTLWEERMAPSVAYELRILENGTVEETITEA